MKRRRRILLKAGVEFLLLLILFGTILEAMRTGLTGTSLAYLAFLTVIVILMIDFYRMEMRLARWVRKKTRRPGK